MSYFIDAADLATALDHDRPPVILDLRFDPGKGSAPERYDAGHVPGARFVRLEDVFADPDDTAGGSNPLPRPEALQESLRDLGVHQDTPVVVYDDTSGGPAARAWWVLTWAGLQDVRVLDGGLEAWVSADQEISTVAPAVVGRGSVTVAPGQLPAIDAAGVAALVDAGQGAVTLVDTRGPAQFIGDESKPRTGHIPGAINVPQPQFTVAGGRLAPAEAIDAVLAEKGHDPGREIVLYCGGGISSAYAALALAERGVTARLYPGSFSQWSADAGRPVEQG